MPPRPATICSTDSMDIHLCFKENDLMPCIAVSAECVMNSLILLALVA